MDQIKNLSIRKTIILSMVIVIIGGFLLGTVAMRTADRWQQRIWYKYISMDLYMELQQDAISKGYVMNIPRPNAYEMSGLDYQLSELCDFFSTYSILVFSMTGMVAAVFYFYKNKIRDPLRELSAASERIAANELNFKIAYTSKDELGTLCSQFESMRQTLYENNLRMWKMLEDQKTLRAAIAHDIRSPLAVLRGYQETMLEFIPENRFDQAALMEMLQSGMNQIDRLNRFVESMRKISSLEEREVSRQLITIDALKCRVDQVVHVMEKASGKKVEIQCMTHKKEINLDEDLMMEVAQNLLRNAFAYAKNKVTVHIIEKEQILELVIMDDGCGFMEETEKLTKAYYHSNPQDDLEHFGLGMYISRLYCEKHGGKLLTGNSKYGGAVVRAIFMI